MSGGGFRLRTGGLIDRIQRVEFKFDGESYQGYSGDSLASALLANGVRVVGRSFKYHRPRGILSAGNEEPNALVELRTGDRREPNLKATTVELYPGLEATSQNRWPSLAFDVQALNGLLKPVFAAGFYYKTFMWPASFWEKIYEPVIRRAAGLGQAARSDDPDFYERNNAHCDLLIIGGGPAGLMAALLAGRAGAKVILCDEDTRIGGRLLSTTESLDGKSAVEWVDSVALELGALPNVQVLTRTSVVAAYDGGIYAAVERVADHFPEPPPYVPRQRFWRIVCRRAILAAGATERPIAFPNNDRPGIMLSTAVRTYLNRFGVGVGHRPAIYTATDDGWQTARDLIKAGILPAIIIDPRPKAPLGFEDVAANVPVSFASRVVGTKGRMGLTSIMVKSTKGMRMVEADALAVSGGFNPSIQLASHFGGRPRWSDGIHSFLASDTIVGLQCAGAAAGIYSLGEVLRSGAESALAAMESLGLSTKLTTIPFVRRTASESKPVWWQPSAADHGAKVFIDFQHDVTASDVVLAYREGYRSVEHLKRYTTLGMATDQGRTSNLDGLAIMASLMGRTMPETGVTLSRPPTVPVALGAVAGSHRGEAFRPIRETPIHSYALSRGASFVDVGQWKRPQYFPLPVDADLQASVNREVNTVRSQVGVTDVSTLGKVEVEGADAAKFLDRVCAVRASAIKVGRCAYFVMLREDGFLKDDGMMARFTEDRYLVYISTAHAAAVYRHMQFCRQVLWPELDVNLVAVTDGWAQLAIAGPKSPQVVQALVDPPVGISQERFPPMTAAEITVCNGVAARLCALSFSGERSFELAVPAGFGESLIRRVMEIGEPYGIAAYGSEAMGVMRIEKGHPAGGEINGQTTAFDLGMIRALAKDKDHVGRALSVRPALVDPMRARLVGVKPRIAADRIRAGAHVILPDVTPSAESDLGWVSSACYSPTLSSWIGLALVSGGSERIGETVVIHDPLRGGDIRAEIVPPCFVDPKSERTRV